MSCIILTHPACLDHEPAPDHPEAPWRLEAAMQRLGKLPDRATFEVASLKATRALLETVHDPAYIETILASSGMSIAIDHETFLSPGSVDAALWAAGAVLEASRRLFFQGTTVNRALALVRPPGHHAERARGLGYCVFNNIALAAHEALRLGAERVAVVDLDAHLGNGTQDILGADPRFLLIDIHEEELFPAGGSVVECGTGSGAGFTLNAPVVGARDSEYLALLDALVAPALELFQPEILLVSLGFDAHERDPLSGLQVSTNGYRAILARLSNFARESSRDRLLAVLEGGYDAEALGDCAAASVEAFCESTTVSNSWTEPPRLPQNVPVGRMLVRLEDAIAREFPGLVKKGRK